MNVPKIKSIGLPPEKHADRVVAEMMRWIVEAQMRRWARVQHVVSNCKDGNPRSQERMIRRLKEAGGVFFFDVFLDPGKRGKFVYHLLDVAGWNPAADTMIFETSAIPEKPWLCCNTTRVISRGRNVYDQTTGIELLVTHHSMSRLAQRNGVREPKELLMAVHSIRSSYLDMRTINMAAVTRVLPEGYRLKFSLPDNDFAWAVLNSHRGDKNGGLVVATILGTDAL
jgi:hypothetical protein